MSQSTASFPLQGGLDLITPPNKLPGRCIAALNYEPTASGYKRFQGFERFDGHPAPSDATYWRLDYTAGGNNGTAPTVGQIIKDTSGSASTHTVGYIVAVVTTSGAWATDDAAGYFIATGMTVNLAGTTGWFSTAPAPQRNFSCTAQTLAYDFGATLNATYLLGAQTVTRNLILVPTGSGAVRGIWGFDGSIYAFRDDAGATSGVMWKATSAGWVAATNLVRVDFTCDTGAGQVIPLSKDHNNVSNSSGGASKGRIETVVITSTVGTVNTGYMLISSYTAATFTAGAQTIYKATTAIVYGTTTAAATTTVTLPPGGRYFFLNYNFYGGTDMAAMYMVNGVGKGLVYNGVGYAEIVTGAATDTPIRLAEHRNSLFLAFPGGDLEASVVGEPLNWSGVLGAVDAGIGSEITDLIPANKSTLTIFAQSSISALYGNDSGDYQLEKLTEQEGIESVSLPYTAQRLGNVVYMDNVGIRSISATASYGNFSLGTLSRKIEPLLRDYRKDGVDPVASLIWKRKDQYWVFFDNGTALVLYVGMKEPQILPLNLGFTVTCATTITIDGIERAFVGTSTGYVMELDKGTSFDGSNIEHYIRLPFTDFGSPQIRKRVHKAIIGIEVPVTATLTVSAEFDYGSALGPDHETLTITQGGGAIDSLGSNEEYYNSQVETIGEVYIDGVAKNVSLKMAGLTSTEEAHTLTSVTYLVSQRGLQR